ncbi:MAG: TetR/AcrR family transcriptional regulator [Alphaproteobacteria bacterium]
MSAPAFQTASTSHASKRKTALSPEQWFAAARDILVTEGIEAIRIDRLCQSLDVTKGSFYWHFTSRAAFLSAFLHHWREGATLAVIENLSGQGLDPQTRLHTLLTLPQRPNAPAAALVEQSIRSWARRESLAREALDEVDKIRLSFIQEMLEEIGFDQAEAEERARMAYAYMLGDAILSAGLSPEAGARPLQDTLLQLFTRPVQPK